jgi:hypothetical protein
MLVDCGLTEYSWRLAMDAASSRSSAMGFLICSGRRPPHHVLDGAFPCHVLGRGLPTACRRMVDDALPRKALVGDNRFLLSFLAGAALLNLPAWRCFS